MPASLRAAPPCGRTRMVVRRSQARHRLVDAVPKPVHIARGDLAFCVLALRICMLVSSTSSLGQKNPSYVCVVLLCSIVNLGDREKRGDITMRWIPVVVGIVLILLGGLWMLQG